MQTLRSKTTHEPAESKLQHDAKQSSATLSAAAARRCLVCDIECHQAEQFELTQYGLHRPDGELPAAADQQQIVPDLFVFTANKRIIDLLPRCGFLHRARR